jgi:hypothetical protein
MVLIGVAKPTATDEEHIILKYSDQKVAGTLTRGVKTAFVQ